MTKLTYIDNQNRPWSLRIGIAEARRLKETGPISAIQIRSRFSLPIRYRRSN